MSYTNFVQLELAAAATAAQTTLVVTTPAAPFAVPAANGSLTLLDIPDAPTKAEIVTYTTVTNNGNGTHTLGGVARAQEGTAAQAWAIGAGVFQSLTAAQYAADLGSKEPSIAAGAASQMWLGNKTWASVLSQVQGALLTGYSVGANAVLAATDNILGALQKLQGQINARLPLAGGTTTGPIILGGPQVTYNYSVIHDSNGDLNLSRYTKAGVWNATLLKLDFNGVAAFSAGVSAPTFTGALNGAATTLSGDQNNWASLRSGAVANMLGWKNYGNGHVLFDASAGTSPTGSAVNNTNPASAWSATYPTLMGWNGSSTYGVRVDSARIADGLPDTGWITPTLLNGWVHVADRPIGYRKVGNRVMFRGAANNTDYAKNNSAGFIVPVGYRSPSTVVLAGTGSAYTVFFGLLYIPTDTYAANFNDRSTPSGTVTVCIDSCSYEI